MVYPPPEFGCWFQLQDRGQARDWVLFLPAYNIFLFSNSCRDWQESRRCKWTSHIKVIYSCGISSALCWSCVSELLLYRRRKQAVRDWELLVFLENSKPCDTVHQHQVMITNLKIAYIYILSDSQTQIWICGLFCSWCVSWHHHKAAFFKLI